MDDIKLLKDFRVEDMKTKSIDQKTWKKFVQIFGSEGYLWLCCEVNGDKLYVPEIDTQLSASRKRQYKKWSKEKSKKNE